MMTCIFSNIRSTKGGGMFCSLTTFIKKYLTWLRKMNQKIPQSSSANLLFERETLQGTVKICLCMRDPESRS